MKKSITAIFFALSFLALGQEEIKMPELDTENKVHILKFTPDLQNEEVISSYMKGITETDSIRFWAEGTIFTQAVMVKVLTPDKNAKLKVDIVKDHWHDSKKSGFTKDGIFQKSFSTANKFGIVITSEKANDEFYLGVWTTGELIPNMNQIYFSASEKQVVVNTNIDSISTQSTPDIPKKDNILLYVVIGTLIIISILLLLLLLKKKAHINTALLLFLLSGTQVVQAQVSTTDSAVFNAVHYVMENADSMNDWFERARETSDAIRDGLSPNDEDATPDPAGGPGLPSSCLPPAEGSMDSTPSESLRNRDPRTDGCACLDLAYKDLNGRRLNLERLRIIYKHAMKKINAGIAFGDNVSGVHGVSGLAWQSQKMIILKESIPTLNKAYDNKYAEMIQALEENLRKIEECEAILGNPDWYNQGGFIYYQFMADKYKRN